MEPCLPQWSNVHSILAVGQVLEMLLLAFLAHRRILADREHKRHHNNNDGQNPDHVGQAGHAGRLTQGRIDRDRAKKRPGKR